MPANRERLAKEVLQSDPAFSEVLDRHREITNRIATYDREMALKRKTAEQAIAQMRKELAAAAASSRVKTAELKKRMEPDRERVTLALAMASEELRAKQGQRASLGRTMTQLKKALKSPHTGWSAQERTRQEARLQEILEDAARFDKEITAFTAHVRLLKIKLLLIKL